MKKNKKAEICLVEGCKKEVHANGLCSKHNNDRSRSGDVAGVYKITLKDKIYIGMSMAGVYTRISTERSRLIENNSESVNKDLLQYFNELCDEEPQLSRKEIASKYFDYEVLFSSPRWNKADENYNTIKFEDEEEQKELTFGANISTNQEVVRRKKLLERLLLSKESLLIKYYKNLDKQNGTHICLNIKD